MSPLQKSERMTKQNSYEAIDLIARSPNSLVYTGRCKRGIPVILKQIPKKTITKYYDYGKRKCPQEIYFQLLASKVSTFVVSPLDWIEKENSYVLVMENPFDTVNLRQFATGFPEGCLPEDLARRIFSQLTECLRELHDSGIIHRDIKPDNVLISKSSFDIKLIDFGCATFSSLADQNVSGTLDFFPPECFTLNEFNSEKMLVWSMGALLYFLLCGEFEVNMGHHRRNFRREVKLTNESRDMLDRLLSYFPSKRISLNSVYKSSWLNERPSI